MPVSVNEATGQLQVSIPLLVVPGLDGEGYQVNLNYSPPSPGSHASWVGYGWNLSPGAITRSLNGIPDDYQGDIINIAKKPDYTRMTGRIVGGGEAFSALSGNIGLGAVWDSERGILPNVSASLNGFGAGISYFKEGGDGVWTVGFNPVAAALAAVSFEKKGSGSMADQRQQFANAKVKNANGRAKIKAEGTKAKLRMAKPTKGMDMKGVGMVSGVFGLNSKRMLSMPSFENGITGESAGFNGSVQWSAFLPDVGVEVGFETNWTKMSYTPWEEKPVTGYMRSGYGEEGMDYTHERQGVLDEYDKFIPTPVAMPDQFSVSAQGLAGSFRAYFNEPGQFHQDGIDYKVTQGPTVGLEFAAGVSPPYGNLTGGASVAGDLKNTLEMETWGVDGIGDFGKYEDIYFAFDGTATLDRAYAEPGSNKAKIRAKKDGSHKDLTLNETLNAITPHNRLTQTKWIRWNTRKKSTASFIHDSEIRFPYRFCNQSLPAGAVEAISLLADDQVAEFQVVNEKGLIYTFGIPVLEKNKVDLSFNHSVENHNGLVDFKVVETTAPKINGYLSSSEELGEAMEGFSNVSGTIRKAPIVTEYLLTSIVSADYVDLKLDGPTEDDLGTWVKFEYEKEFGESSSSSIGWFDFRSPMWGNRFTEGNPADSRDDVASFSFGSKEVYRLKSISTRTHVAKFNCSPRTYDGFAISDLDAAAESEHISSNATCKLDNIKLYAKNADGDEDLLQVIEMDYANQANALVQGINGSGTAALTLNGLTIQSHDVIEETDKAHYNFSYAYPETGDFPTEVQDRYGNLIAEYDDPAWNENPAFSFNATNAWGSRKRTASSEFDVHHPWLDVKSWDSLAIDPAAHCLKQVEMPGGLSAFPQYEPSEYRFVQEEPACRMLTLHADSDDETMVVDLNDLLGASGGGATGDVFDELGLTRSQVRAFYESYFEDRKLFHKVKYELNSESNAYQYFSGFVKIKGVSLSSSGLLSIEIGSDDADYSIPMEVCRDYVLKYPNIATGNSRAENIGDDIEAAVQQFIQRLANVVPGLSACSGLVKSDSYIRVPLPPGMAKHGAGIRVKRLLLLDEGIEDGDALMTGVEYDYTEYDGDVGKRVSSGVAANEPRSLYDECGFYRTLPKLSQTWFERGTQGKDTEKQTGPVGESFLPGPAVLYGEVAAKQIHQGASTTGHTIKRYFTHRQHPTQIRWTDEDRTQLHMVDKQLPLGVYNKTTQELWYAQGFEVEHSQLPGQPINQLAYGGAWDDRETWYTTSATYYSYFGEDEALPVISKWDVGEMEVPQFDELFSHGKKAVTVQESGSLEADVSVQWLPPAIVAVIPSGFATFSEMKQVQAVHGTTRIIQKPAFQKSVLSVETGKVVEIENLAFDAVTLDPVLKSTSDGFTSVAFEHDGDDSTFETFWTSRRIGYGMPAHQWHPELGGKYRNDRKVYEGGARDFAGFSIKKLQEFGNWYLLICKESAASFCEESMLGNVMESFSPGDLLRLKSDSYQSPDFYHVVNTSGNRVNLMASDHFGTQAWQSLLGKSTEDAVVEVVSSGRKNEFGRNVGGIEVYDDALNVTESQRISGQLTFMLNRMNAARPSAFPAYSAVLLNRTEGSSSLKGGTFSDTLRIQEEECARVQDLCALDHFGVIFLDKPCQSGYVIYPFEDEVVQYIGEQGLSWTLGGNTCNEPETIIPIRYNTGETNGGRFEFDHDLGAIVWVTQDNPCNPVVIFTPCRDYSKKIEVANVIETNQQVISDAVDFEGLELASGNDYESGQRGRWVAKAGWSAQSGASSLADDDVHHSRESGIMEEYEALNPAFSDFMVEPYVQPDEHPWIRTAEYTLHDRRGHPIETEDALGFYSSVEFGAQEQLVVWESTGARNKACMFESFERVESSASSSSILMVDSKLDIGGFSWGGHSSRQGHTGNSSLRLRVQGGATGKLNFARIELDDRCVEPGGGLRVRFWVHNPIQPDGTKKYELNSLFAVRCFEQGCPPADDSTPAGVTSGCFLGTDLSPTDGFEVSSVVQTGQWTMMEGLLPAEELALSSGAAIVLQLNWNAAASGRVFMDDLRVQPFNTMMNCKVYDGDDFKLLAELGDSHFAKKFQYNRLDELIRVQIETAAGWKTVSEEVMHTKNH